MQRQIEILTAEIYVQVKISDSQKGYQEASDQLQQQTGNVGQCDKSQ